MNGYETRPPPRTGPGGPLLVLLLVLTGVLGYWLSQRMNRGVSAVAPRPVAARGDLSEEEKSNIAIFKRSSPSVVFITTAARRYDLTSRNVTEIPQGTGSGFIWDDAGHIVTNFHVIRGASRAIVTLADHTAYQAELTGASPENDVAVLKIDAPANRLAPILVGASHDLQVGQRVFAIGDPFGLDQTLTTGIVSALGRSIGSPDGETIQDAIQTDAAINPGNSGGPLLDSAARLIGMNTAIYSPSGSSAGIGFAIPVDTVNRVAAQLIAHGRMTHPTMGVSLSEPISRQITSQIGQPGVLVIGVQPGSPAAQIGLRGTERQADGTIVPGDIIQKMGSRKINNSLDLAAALEQYKPGDSVPIGIYRDGQNLELTIKLGAAGGGGQ